MRHDWTVLRRFFRYYVARVASEWALGAGYVYFRNNGIAPRWWHRAPAEALAAYLNNPRPPPPPPPPPHPRKRTPTMYADQTRLILGMQGEQLQGTVAGMELQHAVRHDHPTLRMADCLLRMAAMHRARYGSTIAATGPAVEWASALHAAEALLNHDFGPVDAGTVSTILAEARKIGGLPDE